MPWLRFVVVLQVTAALISEMVSNLPASPQETAEEKYNQGTEALKRNEFDKAIAHLTEAIRLEPKAADSYVARGFAYHKKRDYDKALADFDQAIQLDPKDALAHNNRGNCWLEKGDFDKAVVDYTEAVRLDPKDTEFINNRGIAHRKKGDAEKAIADHQKALRINPRDPNGYNCLAWLWATYPAEKVRDGKRAVEYARKACELSRWKNPFYLDTLAAAYAEAGHFKEAVQWQGRALETPEFVGMYGKAAEERVKQYQKQKPYREQQRSDQASGSK